MDDFNENILKFETQIETTFDFELLEKNYSAYSFGSGFAAYRIKGKIFRISFDGRDGKFNVEKSRSHQRYPNCEWTSFLYANPKDFLESINHEISESLI